MALNCRAREPVMGHGTGRRRGRTGVVLALAVLAAAPLAAQTVALPSAPLPVVPAVPPGLGRPVPLIAAEPATPLAYTVPPAAPPVTVGPAFDPGSDGWGPDGCCSQEPG